jgi:leucyl-tRNA---protein transferase
MISLPLLLSEELPCSYLDNHHAQSAFVHPDFPLSASIYTELLAQGFRRSGDHVYRPHCQQCTSCIAARVPVYDFQPARNQKRCLHKNQLITAHIKPANFEPQHFELYMRYQKHKHPDSEMVETSPEQYLDFLSCSWCTTQFVEFSINDELAAVAIVDQLDNALSAVYTFFDPKFSSYSLGVYSVLWQINHAKLQQLQWLYLGYWIKDCRKMSYKTQYRPIQLLTDNHWHQFNKDQDILI